MNKRFNKKSKAIILVASMFFSIGTTNLSSHAANNYSKSLSVKDVVTVADTGVTGPNETFTYTALAHSYNADTSLVSKCPSLSSATVNGLETINTDMDSTNSGKQLIKETSDLLDNVTFPDAGQYSYTIKQNSGTTSGMTYSKAEYLLSIMVAKANDGTLSIESIQIKKTVNDDGSTANGNKTEYTPGTGSNNGFEFKNEYIKSGGDTTPIDNTDTLNKVGLVVTKAVSGTSTSNDLNFDFSINLTKPSGVTGSISDAKAQIVDAKGSISGSEINVPYGSDVTFKLKAGEKLVFTNLAYGSTVKVKETDSKGFIPSATYNSGSDINAISNTGVLVSDTDGNQVDYINTKQTPIGIIMNILPFLILIIASIIGFVVYKRNRIKAQYN
ncbi:DUF7601 domain-containing protein [Peptostreptococcus equinus]|uniref:Pilin isopeptide linkage domain-containing protein n=1 Tax=Peptostreptococcus equinus TaxID=3003601 RepID=A0ABY7JQ72_9FIRM|nr:FctA domain-containing protein [Peptostreptococcus sp. CBA3647]WAW14130.1 hypothetical protein O0R46_05855 [Peptostreptococcus sp. CBA3647]